MQDIIGWRRKKIFDKKVDFLTISGYICGNIERREIYGAIKEKVAVVQSSGGPAYGAASAYARFPGGVCPDVNTNMVYRLCNNMVYTFCLGSLSNL